MRWAAYAGVSYIVVVDIFLVLKLLGLCDPGCRSPGQGAR